MPFINQYTGLAVSVDNVIFAFDDNKIKVLLIKRGFEPFLNEWALPGALVNKDEDLEFAANRILKELTGLDDVYLEQVKTFGAINRHPEARVITVSYFSLVNYRTISHIPSDLIRGIAWADVESIDKLPFDHMEILTNCVARLKTLVKNQPVGFELLPPKFTLTQIQKLYEAILQKPLDKRNFRKKILSLKVLQKLDEVQLNVAHRPANLYSFDSIQYQEAKSRGIIFEIG